MRYLTPMILFVSMAIWFFFSETGKVRPVQPKMNGASLVSPRQQITTAQMGAMRRINADWVAIIPYAFGKSGEPSISFDHERQWWGERSDGTVNLIRLARENHLKVMLKPHVWVKGEHWAGDFTLADEASWKIWEKDFSAYILHFAQLADSTNVELFCIGTEYRIPARERPEFWKALIREVRKCYSGKITYASNWDNYMNISWWDAVDYIGIDAYFPLTDQLKPGIEDIRNGWRPVRKELEDLSQKWDKQIVFTEYGFQSMDGAAGKHWEADRSTHAANAQLQADAYEATFQSFMDEEWYAGGFFWKWYFFQYNDERYLTDWTPQEKPAEQVIARWYGRQKAIRQVSVNSDPLH